MRSLNGSTGFLVFPVPEGAFEQRLNALQNLAIGAKYDYRVERQIGVCVAYDENEIEVDSIFLDFPNLLAKRNGTMCELGDLSDGTRRDQSGRDYDSLPCVVRK
jgi:hypothetical protein